MSEDRFDHDLRSVLLEDAPRDVPYDLLRRVAAVPATDPAALRPPHDARRLQVPVAVGVMAALVVVMALAFGPLRPATEPGVGGLSPSPSIAGSSPIASGASSSPAASPSGLVTACRASELTGRILGWQGAAGSRIADVEIANTASRRCYLRGTPGLELVDARERVLINSTTAGPSGQPHVASSDPVFELAPADRIRTEVQASNYCGPAAALPIDVAIALPSGGGRLVAVPGPGVSSADAVPPCLGSSGPVVAMNGWRR